MRAADAEGEGQRQPQSTGAPGEEVRAAGSGGEGQRQPQSTGAPGEEVRAAGSGGEGQRQPQSTGAPGEEVPATGSGREEQRQPQSTGAPGEEVRATGSGREEQRQPQSTGAPGEEVRATGSGREEQRQPQSTGAPGEEVRAAGSGREEQRQPQSTGAPGEEVRAAGSGGEEQPQSTGAPGGGGLLGFGRRRPPTPGTSGGGMRRGPHATGALGAVVRAGVGRRRVQSTVMVLTTLIAVTASVVAAGVLVASRAPFDQAMAEQRGAHLTAWFDPSKATEAQLAATARASGVADAAGPFRTVSLSPRTASASGEMPSGTDLPELTVAGRADAGGPVDRLDLVSGRWATRPGEIVLAEGDSALRTGTRLDFPGLKGTPTLTVVGIARSVTGTADAWVTPAQAKALTTPNGTSGYAMLYRLSSADTDAQVAAGRAAIDAAAPEGALTGTRSHLAVRQEQLANALAFVPFVAAFGVLALAMSVLIIGIVVSGAVGAATRRIGILKSLGFTPAQVVRAYVAQALLPAAIGCALGVALGNLLAGPVLGSVEDVYRGARATIPWWIDVTAPAVALALVAAAAFVPALRAGRLRTVEALTVGRTAETGRGRGPTGPAKGRTPGRLTGRLPLPRLLGRTPTPATGRPAGRTPHPPRRLAGRLPLPQPVTLGLAHPLSRPARSATTAAAVALATVTVTFAVGLALTLGAVQAQRMLDAAAPVVVETGRGQGGPAGAAVVPAPGQQPRPQADPADVTAALKAEQRTRRYYSTAQGEVRASGITGRTAVVGYDGDASWAAPELVSGSWLSGPGQAVVTERFLDAAGVRVGDSLTLTEKGRSTTVRIVGEAFFTEDDGMLLLTQATTLTALGLDADPHRFYAQPDPGTATSAYLTALNDTLADTGAFAHTNTDNASSVIAAMDALIAMLTLMLVAVAGLGVLNTVVLDTRDRIHDLGTLKALGMTPRQTVGMVLTSVTGIGLLAAAAGVPLGIALHHYVTPLMGDAVGMNLPDAFLTVYAPLPLTLLALGGVSIAVGGALLPAGWAARTDTAKALRTE